MNAQNNILDFITTQLLQNKGQLTLQPDQNLLLSGLIDSHGVIRLVKYIENSFAIKVTPGEITLKNFKTVNAMVSFIDRKTAAAA